MLNKVKIGALIGAVLLVLRMFLPEVDFPEGLQDAIMLIIVFVSQFFIKETPSTVNQLELTGVGPPA